MATGTYTFVTEQRRKGRREGRQAGELDGIAKSVLRVLKKRGISVDDHSRRRILACTDASTLGNWLENSVEVSKASDLFAR